MTEFDWDQIRTEKDLYRARAAELPFEEKLKILERLRDRVQTMSGRHQPANASERDLRANATNSANTLSIQPTGGLIHLGVLGANSTLAAVVTASARSSARATTIRSQPE